MNTKYEQADQLFPPQGRHFILCRMSYNEFDCNMYTHVTLINKINQSNEKAYSENELVLVQQRKLSVA